MRSVGLGLLGFLLSILVVEIYFRVVELTPAWRVLPALQGQFGQPDPVSGYSLRPNIEGVWVRENRVKVSTNSFGMRDSEMDLAKPPRTARIALMGDSVTQAWQVEHGDTFDSLTEVRFLKRFAETVQVLNFGVSGTSPLQQLLRLENLGLQFDPDLVVFLPSIEHFTSTDMTNDLVYPAYVEQDDQTLTIGRRYLSRRSIRWRDTWVGTLFFFALNHSRTASLVYTRMQTGMWARPGLVPRARVTDSTSCMDPHSARLALWRDSEPAEKGRLLDKYLSDAAVLSSRSSIRFVFAVRGIGYRQTGCDRENRLRDALAASVRERLQREGLVLIDIDAEIEARVSGPAAADRLYGFWADVGSGHLNQKGHEIYSAILVEGLWPYLPE